MSGDTLLDDALFFPDTHRLSREGNEVNFDTDAWDDEVLDVIDKARQTHAVNRSVHYFLEYHKQDFLELLERQVNLIKTRSAVLKHNRITIYDKALLNLTRSGRDLDEPAAIVVFCEEYLGISIGAAHEPAADVTNALGRAIELRSAVIRDAPDRATSYQRSPAPEPEQPAMLDERQTHMQVVDAQVTRLWQVYEQAKADFYAVPNREGQELTDAAKFLRDTAENALQYLADKGVDPDAMAELQSTFNMAKATVVSLTGGRKRKFDIVDQLQPAPRGPEADIEMVPTGPYGFDTFEALPPPPAAPAEYAPSYRRRRFDPRREVVNLDNREMSEIAAGQHYHHFQKSPDSECGAAGGGRYPSYGGEWETGRDRHRSHRHGHGHGERERSRSRRHKDHAVWEGGRERERERERDHYHHSHHQHHRHHSHRRSRSEEEDKYWRRAETPPYDRHRSRERAGPYHNKREVDSYKPSRK
ncbi:hypothetical protein LTS17_004655 [Exophiala oligosperma]